MRKFILFSAMMATAINSNAQHHPQSPGRIGARVDSCTAKLFQTKTPSHSFQLEKWQCYWYRDNMIIGNLEDTDTLYFPLPDSSIYFLQYSWRLNDELLVQYSREINTQTMICDTAQSIIIQTLPIIDFEIAVINGIAQIAANYSGDLIMFDQNGIPVKYYEIEKGVWIQNLQDLMTGYYIASFYALVDGKLKFISKQFII